MGTSKDVFSGKWVTELIQASLTLSITLFLKLPHEGLFLADPKGVFQRLRLRTEVQFVLIASSTIITNCRRESKETYTP